jgi:hypothetical protein
VKELWGLEVYDLDAPWSYGISLLDVVMVTLKILLL